MKLVLASFSIFFIVNQVVVNVRCVLRSFENSTALTKDAFVWEYSGIYSGYSAPGSRIAGMEIQVFRNRKSSQTNANLHYSNYSYSGLIPNERALTNKS